MGLSASTNVEGADKFVEDFGKIIEDGRYHPEQIFNVDETGLSFFLGGGKIPERSYIHKEKKTHTWIQVEAISHSKNPWALKNVSKHMLPVYYCANNKALLAQTLFEDSFINCLIPSVRNCLEKGIPFKVIVVLLDNAPCHP